MSTFLIPVPVEFDFDHCMTFLQRSPRELLHRCGERKVTKLVQIQGAPILFDLFPEKKRLKVQVLSGDVSEAAAAELIQFVREWFDLDTDLKPFYQLAETDKLLRDVAAKFYGYRIIGQPDLFESLVWAVIGQQINLQFAYTLKQRFVEAFGGKVVFAENTYYTFPSPGVIRNLNDAHLLPLQFSRQKSKYVVNIAEAFARGDVSKELLKGMPLQEAKELLMKIKGVGNWTANYALMKTFRYPDAFPLEDAGIHNAIKNLKKMKTKPTLDQVKRVFRKYKGWEAYATLYLWKTL